MNFEQKNNFQEKPLFRLACRLFGRDIEIKTDKSSQPASLDANCADKKVELGVNENFAKLVFGELASCFGTVMLERQGQKESARKFREIVLNRRKNSEFGETMDKIDEVLQPFAKALHDHLTKLKEECG